MKQSNKMLTNSGANYMINHQLSALKEGDDNGYINIIQINKH